jgi:hypothetical protein
MVLPWRRGGRVGLCREFIFQDGASFYAPSFFAFFMY